MINNVRNAFLAVGIISGTFLLGQHSAQVSPPSLFAGMAILGMAQFSLILREED